MKPNNGKVWAKINDGTIEIRSLTLAELDGALDILDKSFFLNESICNGCEINKPANSQARRELRELCRIAAEDCVSLVAIEVATGKEVAVAFNKIQYIPEGNELPFFIKFRDEQAHSPQAKFLMDFMIDVEEEYDVFEKFNLDCTLELMFLSTLPEWERKGIARGLTKYTIELGRKLSQGIGAQEVNPLVRSKRPKAVTALFTSLFSQKVGRSQGFNVLNAVPYTRFSFNGKSMDQRLNPLHKVCEHVAVVF